MDKEEWIRRRAYNIWCAEGWPKGRDKEHWEQAQKEAEREAQLGFRDENTFVSRRGQRDRGGWKFFFGRRGLTTLL